MPLRMKLSLLVLTVAAVGAFVVAAQQSGSGDRCPRPAVVERLIPECGDTVFLQDTVGVVLAPGYQAELAVNGTTIPPDEVFSLGVEGDEALGVIPDSFAFRPGPGRALERLRPDQNCVTARMWHVAEGRDAAIAFTWCFRAA